MDRAALLQRANHYRYLADGITDEQTRSGLLDLAKKYEALAREVAKRAASPREDTAD